MAKRIYTETVKRWAIRVGITGGTLVGLIFMYLIAIGSISNVSYSGDVVCAGTELDPCYAYINFTANEDIFIYPTDYDPWGRDTLFSFDPNVKSWKLERSWGKGWRVINLSTNCKGTWCGAPDNSGRNTYSIVFREGKEYKIRITGYKNNPTDTIKWGAFSGTDEIDPVWIGINPITDKNINEELNITYQGRSIPLEDYLNVYEENGRIKFETLDNKICFLELEYEKENILDVPNQKINVIKKRGGYYFTTDVGVKVNSMAYKMNCSNFNINFDSERNVFLMDNIKIDFNEAKDKQNISTTYDNQTQKLIFLPDKDEFGNDKKANLRMIDPDVTIDDLVESFQHLGIYRRKLVWTDKDTGYIFFNDHFRDLHYRKTTDAGASWGTEVSIRTGTVNSIAVWYDKWTKDDTGDVIHIAFVETITDDILYRSLDTSDDSLSGLVTVFDGASATDGSTVDAVPMISIVKARGGNIYVGGWIDGAISGGENGFWRSTASPATSFSARVDTGFIEGDAIDRIMFLAGSEADSNDIWSLYQDESANEITLKVYDNSGNSWSESSAIDTVVESPFHFSFDAMDRHSDSHAILALWNEDSSATGDLTIWEINDSTTFTSLTDVVTDDSAYGIAGLLINQQNDDLYVAYASSTDPTPIVYQLSQDGGGTWDGETAMSVTSGDHRAVTGGTSVGDEGGRWMPVWFNDDLNDLLTNSDNSVEIVAVAADTCTYSSGNFDVVCSDNCTITSNIDLGGNNLTLDSTKGNFTISGANITNFDNIIINDPGICMIRIFGSDSGFVTF